MTLGIMQPYFFPYVGYFSVIAASDMFILFDTAQYIRHGWVNRNRILKPSKDDWQYITIPLAKHHRETPISEIRVRNDGWEKKIIAQLQHYKKRAPFYKQVISLVEESLLVEYPDDLLIHRLDQSLKLVCEYCLLDVQQCTFSELGIEIKEASEPDEWALNICSALEANHYVNPEGGMDFFDTQKYENSGISVDFLRNNLSPYHQPNSEFIAGLSIIDVLMFNNAEDTRKLIMDYSVVKKGESK